MFGFIGYIGEFDKNKIVYETYGKDKSKIIENLYGEEDFFIRQCTLDKFADDKVFFVESDVVITVEGIIYNYSELKKQYGINTNTGILYRLYKTEGENFIRYLNGNFSMAVYDKEKLFLYCNHTSYKPLFYMETDSGCIFSTDINWLMQSLEYLGVGNSLDTNSAVCLLTHGYMLGDNTLVKTIKKILPGHYISCTKGRKHTDVEWLSYQDIEELSIPYNDILERAETLFSSAVDRIYKKDEEYGYRHFCTLSGGLDSRSVAFVAGELGYDQTFATIGEKGCMDELVATQIAKKLGGMHIIRYLDGGKYLTDIDSAVISNGGTITYPGFAHLFSLFRSIDLNDYGQICTGEMGDLLFGGGHEDLKYRKPAFYTGALAYIKGSENLLSEQYINKEVSRYKNAYLFFLYNRGLNSAQNGWYASYMYTESASPFLDIDFIQFILSVPGRYLKESELYIDWMKKYHPDMCKFKWTTTRTRPDAFGFVKCAAKVDTIIRTRVLKQALSMNPYQKWIDKDERLHRCIKNNIVERRDLINNSAILKKMYNSVMRSDNIQNVFMLASLLIAIDKFHMTCNE